LCASNSRDFDLQYLLGRVPWDTGVTPPEVVALIERGDLSPSRALDLGCGTGTNCIYLVRHGWEAVGVDFSALAIRRARRKARRAGVDCWFYQADVTDLQEGHSDGTPPQEGHSDGTPPQEGHSDGTPPERWERYAAGVARLVQPGGVYMLYAFTPPRPERPTRGLPPGEVRRLLALAFAVERQEGGDDATDPRSAWYWLRRLDQG